MIEEMHYWEGRHDAVLTDGNGTMPRYYAHVVSPADAMYDEGQLRDLGKYYMALADKVAKANVPPEPAPASAEPTVSP